MPSPPRRRASGCRAIRCPRSASARPLSWRPPRSEFRRDLVAVALDLHSRSLAQRPVEFAVAALEADHDLDLLRLRLGVLARLDDALAAVQQVRAGLRHVVRPVFVGAEDAVDATRAVSGRAEVVRVARAAVVL